MRSRIVRSVGLALVMLTSPVIAHHSDAVYNEDKLATVTGTVVKFEWINPHIITRVDVTNDKGNVEQWVVLGGSVRSMHGGGWDARILKPGDVVTVSGHPYRDGRPSMSMLRVVRVRPDPRELPMTSVERSNYEAAVKRQQEGNEGKKETPAPREERY